MYDSSKEPCCMAHVTSGGQDVHEPKCPEEVQRQLGFYLQAEPDATEAQQREAVEEYLARDGEG